MISTRLPADAERIRLLQRGVVVSNGGRCIECGICVRNCPMGVDVRSYARLDRPVTDRRCLLCGSCVVRCPRGNLRFVISGGAT
ncbi:MAG TPA: 4Fe-4S dicluster domain-containing protein [Longimicrobiales bacterium]